MKKLIILITLSILSLIYPYAASGETRNIELRAERYSYTPNIITVNKGDIIRLKLISTDVTHGFYLDGYEINFFARPGENKEVVIKADRTGRFVFRCSNTCGEFHPYMIGYLRVLPNTNLYAGMLIAVILGIGSLLLSLIGSKKFTDGSPKERLFGIIPLEWRFELTKFKPVRALLKSRWFPYILIVLNLFIFTIILVAGFTGGFSSGNYNFGIMLVWILWWVLLMLVLVPGMGRVWCMMCPFPLFGDWLQRGKLLKVGKKKPLGLGKRWPNELRNLWPVTVLFFVTTFFSGFFTVRPFATFLLLAIIIGFATIIAVIYEKRSFCLYFCPVSGFQGLYANFAAAEVRVKNPEICKKHRPKTCFVGNEKGYGCPWNEQPYTMDRNTYCGLCMECFKTCPYDNMALNVRPPGVGLLEEPKQNAAHKGGKSLAEAFKGFTMIGIMVVFFLTMQGPYGIFKDMVRALTIRSYFVFIIGHSIFSFIIIPGIFFLFSYLSKLFSKNREISVKQILINFSALFIPIGLAAWAAFSIGIILPNGSYLPRVVSDPFAWGWNLFGTAGFRWTPFLTGIMPHIQIFFILIGLIFSLDYGYKIARRTYTKAKEANRGWVPIFIFLIGIHISLIWLFVG